MNKDEVKSLVTSFATLLLSSSGAAAYVDGSTASGLVAGAGALVTVGYGLYAHWNMKKVPETAIVK